MTVPVAIGISVIALGWTIYDTWNSANHFQNVVDRLNIRLVQSLDPNDKFGPQGFGGERYLCGGEMHPFRIVVENRIDDRAIGPIARVNDIAECGRGRIEKRFDEGPHDNLQFVRDVFARQYISLGDDEAFVAMRKRHLSRQSSNARRHTQRDCRRSKAAHAKPPAMAV